MFSSVIPKSKNLVPKGVVLAFLQCTVQLKNIHFQLVGLFLIIPS